MITVTYRDIAYVCDKAIKGDNYIHLLDASGCMIAAFDGISNFDIFTISGGGWTTPSPDDECYLAVVREDGTVAKGGHKCNDVAPNPRYQVTLASASSGWTQSDSTYSKILTLAGVKPTDLVAIVPETQKAWAQSYLGIVVGTDTITISTSVLPPEDCVLYMYLIRTSGTVVL